VRQRQGRERAEPAGVAGDQLGVLVVDAPGRVDGSGLVSAVRQLGGGGQDLHADPGAVHQREPGVQLRAVPGAHAAA